MISSAGEFIYLRDSDVKSEYDRSATESASIAVWYEIIEKHPAYRRWVAHNKTIPIEILERLSECDAETRWFVAVKRKLSPALFEKLSRDIDSSVRSAIASNKKTPLSILGVLINDNDKDVSKLAMYNYGLRVPLNLSGPLDEK